MANFEYRLLEEIKSKIDQKILPFVDKPGRYIGNEFNIIVKPDAEVRIALCFPDVYEIGMSYIGFKILYNIVNKIPWASAERVYAPWVDAEEIMRKEGIPLFSLETKRPLKLFDVIGFTFQYELHYTNILNMLNLGNVPIFAKDRTDEDPIVIAGGPVACNPEPMSAFIDAFLLGDGENLLPAFLEIVRKMKKEGAKRDEILLTASKTLQGVYVPKFYEPVYENGKIKSIKKLVDDVPLPIKRNVIPELKPEYYPDKPVVPLIEVVHDRFQLEIMRGCTQGCRFCNAGMIYRPVRERSVDDLINETRTVIENTGYEEMSLVSLSTSDYSLLPELMSKNYELIKEKHVSPSFPSLRPQTYTKGIAKFAREGGASGLTFAPEAGTERLRRVINKQSSEEDFYRAVEIAIEYGWRLVKLYFMMGLPTETYEDLDGILKIAENVVKIARQKKVYNMEVHVSVSPFSPKPHTPFQWERQNSIEELLDKAKYLRSKNRYKNIKLDIRDPRVTTLETILGRGDRRISNVIYSAWKKGAKFDAWTDKMNFDLWLEALNEHGFKIEDFIREFDKDEVFPWDHIFMGVLKKFLWRDREKAYKEAMIPDCRPEDICHACGACDFKTIKMLIREQVDKPDKTAQYGEVMSMGEDIIWIDKSQENETKQIETYFYRMKYTKEGYLKYISHLDLVRLFNRIFRKSGLKVAYTQGFHPHPKFSFSAPLPLGYSSLCEFIDFELEDHLDVEGIKDRLASNLPDGMRVIEIKEISKPKESLDKQINLFEYKIYFTSEKLADQIQSFLSKDEILIHKVNQNGKLKTLNIRKYIREININNNGFTLQIIRDKDGVMPRVDLILEILLGLNKEEIKKLKIERTGQFICKDGVIFDPIDYELVKNKIGVFSYEEGNLYQHEEERNTYSSS
ncbi:MAG: TIGR03960 family B12-binding radical SAM protein [Candidatus Kryptonium sp.]|nr:TIGR03960 family B12-binding radical SAM protein [Candidatus Kryptonium sp.]